MDTSKMKFLEGLGTWNEKRILIISKLEFSRFLKLKLSDDGKSFLAPNIWRTAMAQPVSPAPAADPFKVVSDASEFDRVADRSNFRTRARLRFEKCGSGRIHQQSWFYPKSERSLIFLFSSVAQEEQQRGRDEAGRAADSGHGQTARTAEECR